MEFTTPYFLQNKSVDDIFRDMQQVLPADIDISEGSHEWNMIRPSAIEISKMCQFILPEVIKIFFPSWSYGDYLDGLATQRGMTRRAATAAKGTITITGAANTVIPINSMFSTASINSDPSVDYVTLAEATIPPEGTIDVEVECTKKGIIGNTPANTIIFVASKLTGVKSVTNNDEITGGTEVESDASLIERIEEYDATQGQSFVGNPNDYKRWAKSVDGVGEAVVISAQDDSGMVTIILTDANGAPANQPLREAVYNYIMRPDAPGERMAPVGAFLTVSAPAELAVSIKATIELVDGFNIEAVKAAFLKNLIQYLPTASEEKEIKCTRIASILSQTDGVNDYADLQIGKKNGAYGTTNITIETTELPTIAEEDLVLTSGTV